MNTLTETMNLPLIVAALTSVGLHSIIWFYQPVVPMADKAKAESDRRSVRVVQLSPEEILRLPEYAQQRTQPTLPSLPDQIPTNLLPNLPEAKSAITLPPPPSFPIYNPNPGTTAPTPQAKTPTSQNRTRTTVPKSPQDTARNNRNNNQAARNQKPETNEKITLDQLNFGLQFQRPDSTNNQSVQPNQPEQNNQGSGGEFGATYQRFLAQQNANSTSESTQSSSGETQNPGSQNNEQTAGTLLDRNQLQRNLVGGATDNQDPKRNEENTTGTENRNNLRNNQNQRVTEARLKAVYGYNAANTGIPQGIANYRQWLDEKIKNKKYAGKLNTERQPITDSIRSPFDVQLPDVTPAGIAVLVDPKGKIVGEPELTRSTGYPQLNKLAIEQIKKRSFPETGKYEVYPYLIEVDQKNLPNPAGTGNS